MQTVPITQTQSPEVAPPSREVITTLVGLSEGASPHEVEPHRVAPVISERVVSADLGQSAGVAKGVTSSVSTTNAGSPQARPLLYEGHDSGVTGAKLEADLAANINSVPQT